MTTVQAVLVWVVSVQLMDNILALDQSSRVTGYAVFKDNVLTASGTFTVTDTDMSQRLLKIRNYIIGLIQKHEITKVLIEDIQLQTTVGNNVKTYRALAEVIGVCEELFAEIGLQYEIVHSESWKSTLGIGKAKREVQKKQAQEFVLKTYNKKVSQDESDAICIGTHYIRQNKSAF